MKVSTLLGAVFTAASTVSAFPWMAELVKEGLISRDGKVLDERGIFDGLTSGSLTTKLSQAFGAPVFNSGQTKTLLDQFTQARDMLKGVQSPSGAGISGKPRSQLSGDVIYDIYGLGRTNNYAYDNYIWDPKLSQLPDMQNYRKGISPRYTSGRPIAGGDLCHTCNNTCGGGNYDKDWERFNLPTVSNKWEDALGFGVLEDANHPWQPPTHGQTRGPCPGLNTAANHGYLPRSGIVTPLQLFIGTYQALSLSPDMCLLLGAISFIWKGDPLRVTLSIGTNKDVYGNPMPNHIGTGIGEHGGLEGDASVTRADHTMGNVWALSGPLYNTFLNEIEQDGGGQVNVKALAKGRYRAWQNTVYNNKQGDLNPWRLLVAYAESGFTHEALRGDSKSFTPEMIESWFYYERFPVGWRRRKVPCTIAEMVAWGAVVWAASPITKDLWPTPGWSVFGLWVPIPTIGNLARFFTKGGSGGTIGDLGCSVKDTFYGGLVPGWLRGLVGGVNLGGNSGFAC